MTWDGCERRKMSSEDHDLLIKIDANLNNHFEILNNHLIDDKSSFKKITDDMDWVKKVLYGCVGVVVFIELFSKVVK